MACRDIRGRVRISGDAWANGKSIVLLKVLMM